jgi:putative spermidine/putrescine transport system substrate-binding protein
MFALPYAVVHPGRTLKTPRQFIVESMRRKHSSTVKFGAALVASLLMVSACGGDSDTADEATTTVAEATSDCPAADLKAAAEAEGKVNLIALPDNWANYKGILAAFGEKYPNLEYPVANPDASSADELTAVETLKGQDTMPDALDVSPAIAQEVDTKGYWEPYKPCGWEEIPAELKDADGKWVAAYYGVMAIGSNNTLVKEAPTSFADLKDAKYKGQVALNGDPRESGAAFAAVMAASLANGGSFDDIVPGIQYFADLKASGNMAGTDVTEATVLSGETPIFIDWTYNYPGLLPKLAENGIEITTNVPSDGVYGGYYAQGVVKGGPNNNAAKLWIDHITSDEGALGYIAGGAVPARYDALVKAGKVTADMTKNLPPADLIAGIKFPTQDQIAKAKEVLAEQWPKLVG